MYTKYTADVLAPAVAESTSIAGVLRCLGLKQAGGTQAHIAKRIKQLNIDTSHFTGRGHMKGKTALNVRSNEDVLCVLPEGSYRAKRSQLLRAMLAAGLDYACVICYNDGTWQGQSLTLQIDHVNGEWLDNRIQNLRFLCPNCHTQTITYSKKKNKPA